MAKVYEFPVKKTVPDDVAEKLYEVGKAYLEVLQYALETMSSEDPSMAELDEIRDLVVEAYAVGLTKALMEAIEEP